MNDQERLLTIFLRLQSGAHLSKSQLASEFDVSEKTIQRDFALLGAFLEGQPALAVELAYDRQHHTRYFKGKTFFSKKDILIISKILLENRALNKDENKSLINGLLALVPKEEQKEIVNIIGSELLNYAPLADQQDRIDKIWEWSEAIRKEMVLDIQYQTPYSSEKNHTVFPVSLYYDLHYFYSVVFHLKHQSYTTLRLDRVRSWSPSEASKPAISHGQKFRDGDIRNLRVDPFIGRELRVKVRFIYDPTIVLDQFPTANILEKTSDGTIIEFVSQDTPGLKRWLLNQGEALTVLSPQSLVADLKKTITAMKNHYQ